VDEALRPELEWEFALLPDASTPHHVLSNLVYGTESLREHFTEQISGLLHAREPSHATTLENALTVILGSPRTEPAALATLAGERYATATEPGRRLTWLIAWFCVEANGALEALRNWLAESTTNTEADQRMISFCNALVDHRVVRFRSNWHDFERIDVLRELLPLVYAHVRIEDDRTHEGVYTPDDRDNACHTRGYLLQRLYETPGHATYDTLREFSHSLSHPYLRYRVSHLARQRAAADGEPDEPWQPHHIAEFALSSEREPRSARDLFDLTLNRLDDLKLELEEGDVSEASLLRRAEDESQVRTWFASHLRANAGGHYSVPPEEELADRTRPDLRIHNANIDAPVPIELKISDNWRYSQLSERLRNQLVGQYLRDNHSRFGIFLMTWHGGKRWRYQNRGQVLTLDQLVIRLQQEADEIVTQNTAVDGLAVVGIDLTRRGWSAPSR
jgi:hypothetical protein